MISVNVSLVSKEIMPDAPIVDGTTEKNVEFRIYWPDTWDFRHVITDGSQKFNERIDKLRAHGGITISVREFQDEEPTGEWLDEVVRAALIEADGISWEGGGLRKKVQVTSSDRKL